MSSAGMIRMYLVILCVMITADSPDSFFVKYAQKKVHRIF